MTFFSFSSSSLFIRGTPLPLHPPPDLRMALWSHLQQNTGTREHLSVAHLTPRHTWHLGFALRAQGQDGARWEGTTSASACLSFKDKDLS